MEKEMTFAVFFRKIFEWEWYTDSNTFHLFFHCIMRANHKAGNYRGIQLKRGQFVAGRKKLSVETGLSEQQIRTILKRLQSTNELTIKSNRKNSIITVNNYDEYQSYFIKKRKNQPTKQPTINQQSTTNNNDNNNTINTSINISLSKQKNEKPKITKEEREILKSFSKKSGAKNINAYIRKLIENGDYLEILESEKKKAEKKRAEKARFSQTEKDEEIIWATDEDFQSAKRKVEEIKRRIKNEHSNIN